MQICKRLKRPLYNIAAILPCEYTREDLLSTFKEYYPIEWNTLVERSALLKRKNSFLKRVGKKARYDMTSPEVFFFNIPHVHTILGNGYKKKHKETYNEEKRHEAIVFLRGKRNHRVSKLKEKIDKCESRLQRIDPYYLDILLHLYHRKGNTVKAKMEIVLECKKFHTEAICNFFYKLNDSERNDQIRNIAFHYLQDLGHYVRLRKKFKGKQKNYMTETAKQNYLPLDLSRKIEQDPIQSKKKFDVFISHRFADNAIVLKVKDILNRQHKLCYCDWLSDHEFLQRKYAGEYTKIVLKKRIDQSSCVLFICTDHSLDESGIKSCWIKMELEYAKSKGKKIYTLELPQLQSNPDIPDNEIENRLLGGCENLPLFSNH